MNGSKMNSKAICILGMHRSGTSTITRAINLLGAYLGEASDLLQPGICNPEGFWERLDIVLFNDRVLRHFKRAWDATLPLPEGWQTLGETNPLRDELVQLVKKDFKGRELWAWKDPRTTFIFDIWKDSLNELGVDLACIFVLRNPLDVAKSLKKRDGFTYDRSCGIWFNYNIAALRASVDLPRVFVSYDRFMKDWEKELKRCASDLDIPWPEDDTNLKKEMNSFIRPDLRHSVSGLKDLEEAGAPYPVIKLYELLEGIMDTSKTGESFNQRVEELSREFLSYSRFFRDDMERAWDMELKCMELERQISELQGQLSHKESLIADLQGQLLHKESLIAGLQGQIRQIVMSKSWRITRPLREINKILKKVK